MTSPISILDGGMSRELVRAGAPFRQPEWSAHALIEGPDFVRQVHSEFLDAGADVITMNNYAIVPFHMGEERFRTEGRALADLAGRLAREATETSETSETSEAPTRPTKVAGSIPPVFGSYRPDLFDADLAPSILAPIIDSLSPHVDIWIAETQSSIAEVRAIRATLGTDTRPLWISFSLNDDDRQADADNAEPTLRAGESIAEIGADALLSNCSEAEITGPAIRAAVALDPTLKIGVYANAFAPETKKLAANTGLCDIRADLVPATYLTFAQRWVDAGATIVGGCCEVGTPHIAELALALNPAHVPA